jgi:prolyl oligopeptidase
MSCPAARYFGVSFAPDGPASTTRATTRKGTLLYQHVLGTRNSRDTLIFGHEFRGERWAGNDLFRAGDRRRPLPGHQIDRGVPAKRVDIVYRDLTKPGFAFRGAGLGLDSRFRPSTPRARGM